MNVLEKIQQEIDKETIDYKAKMERLNKMKEMAQALPAEIQQYDDCIFTYHSYYFNTLSICFDSDETIKKLKVLGIQGFRTAFWGDYNCDPDRWVWKDGKLELNDYKFEFMGGHPTRPPMCQIEEYEETPEAPKKRLRAICTMTGEKV